MLYICIEASSPAIKGDTALIESNLVSNAPHINCLSFFYHMYGQDVNTLNVLIRSDISTDNPVKIWSKSGNQGNVWLNGRVNIDKEQTFQEYFVQFEAVRGVNYLVYYF